MQERDAIPAQAGVGLKPEHYDIIAETRPELGWFEVHAENYMGPGGAPHHHLERIRRDYALSLHGVGLSLGSDEPLDPKHLQRLKALNDRYEPGLFSEHLAWSVNRGVYLADLLPIPYTRAALGRISDHLDRLQETLGRQVLIENPSHYLAPAPGEMSEAEFLQAVVARTGCALLLDLNNVHVSAANLRFSAQDYVSAFPLEHVAEIHLAGHAVETEPDGGVLFIDAHDRSVCEGVWGLFSFTLERTGALPALVEWDNDLPDWPTLLNEARRADGHLLAAAGTRHAVAG